MIRSSHEISVSDLKTSDECDKTIAEVIRIISKIKIELEQDPESYSCSTPYLVWKARAEKAKNEFSALLNALYARKKSLIKKEKNETQSNGGKKFDQIFRSLALRELGKKKFDALIQEAEDLYNLSRPPGNEK